MSSLSFAFPSFGLADCVIPKGSNVRSFWIERNRLCERAYRKPCFGLNMSDLAFAIKRGPSGNADFAHHTSEIRNSVREVIRSQHKKSRPCSPGKIVMIGVFVHTLNPFFSKRLRRISFLLNDCGHQAAKGTSI